LKRRNRSRRLEILPPAKEIARETPLSGCFLSAVHCANCLLLLAIFSHLSCLSLPTVANSHKNMIVDNEPPPNSQIDDRIFIVRMSVFPSSSTSSAITDPTKTVPPSGSAASGGVSAPNQSAAVSSPAVGGGAKSSDASTSSHHSGSHAPGGGGGGGPGPGRPPMHPASATTTPTSASGDGATTASANDYTIPLANFDTSKVPLGGHGGGTGSAGAGSTGTGTPSGYRPGYSSGASTPTESLDGSRHAGGQRGSATSGGNGGGGLGGKNPKTLLHSSSILGLDKMIEDRKAEGNLTNNVVHMEVPFGKPIEEVYDGVHDGPVLGSGISGLVRLITHKSTGVKYAVKCLDLGLVETEEGLQQLREEIYIMCQLDHPNIVRLEEVYESHSEIYLVQELCIGGELFDRLDEQPDYHYTEAQCARLVKQMLCSVRYIHSKGIIHRDLKLENFLFSNTLADSELKMIDFGLSKHFKFGEVQHEAVGTPYTVAPEVIRGCYDERCDVWAIGVITFLLLSGDPPFGGCGGPESLMQVRENILRGKFEFDPEDIWENVSQEAQNFISTLLVTDPNRRPTAREVQKSTWLRKWASRDRKGEDPKLNPNVVKSLVNFKEYSDMRKLLCEVLSFTLLPDQIQDLRREFEKMDTDGSGEISLFGLKHVLMENAGAGSLGALTEEEVEDIFNAMRVRKTETRIHWHEFIAAGLSHCQVDERNLKLAFDRLDSDHKGYITFENVMDLMGNDASQSEDAMRRMWGDSMKACQNKDAHITYDDFLLLMKGQTRESARPGALAPPAENVAMMGGSSRGLGLGNLDTLHEIHSDHDDESPDKSAIHGDDVLVLPSGDVVHVADGAITDLKSKTTKRASMDSIGNRGSMQEDLAVKRSSIGSVGSRNQLVALGSAPGTPLIPSMAPPDIEEPLSMDDDDEMLSQQADLAHQMKIMQDAGMIASVPNLGSGSTTGDFTPPQSPTRGARDFITPISQRAKLTSPASMKETVLPELDRPELSRLRSRSVDDRDRFGDVSDGETTPVLGLLPADSRRAIVMPEHLHNQEEVDSIIKDETKTALVVNRQLYRAHRQMRLAVLEASKRFEEQRAEMEIERLKAANPKTIPSAGLTMRHGHKKELSSDSLRHIMMQNQKNQNTNLEKANRRGGRGRRSRKKTVSDMAGMLSSVPAEELIMDPTPSKADKESPTKEDTNGIDPSDSTPAESAAPPESGVPELDETDSAEYEAKQHYHLKPTTPGVFRKTIDPFSEMTDRIYGLKNMGQSEMHIGGFQSMAGTTFAHLQVNPNPGRPTPAAYHAMERVQEPMDGTDRQPSMTGSASDGELKNLQKSESQSSPESQAGNQQGTTDDGEKKNSEDVWPPPPPLT